ncbi:hypothetical protein D3C76_855390 [compost metagenome]
MFLKAPEVLAQPAITDLHFVGDAHAAPGAHLGIGVGQIARRQRDAAGIAVHRLANDASQLTATAIEVGQLGIDVTQVVGGAVGTAKTPTEGVRRLDRVHPVWPGLQCLRVIGDGR